MVRRVSPTPLLPLGLDRASLVPLHRQLYGQLRDVILAGRLPPGARLPASRLLAEEHGLSRNTVMAAYDQLFSEGFIEGRHGSGSYVSPEIPERRPQLPRLFSSRSVGPAPAVSARGRELAGSVLASAPKPVPFAPGVPDSSDFPFEVWARLLAKNWRRPSPELIAASDPAGFPPLRQAIADYLATVRAARCSAAQVIIVSGARQAVGLAARVLLDAGDTAWMEEPGFPGVRAALIGAGVKVAPVPVDDEGIDLAAGQKLAPRSHMIVVSPSHQYPLGITMSLARRLELLARARQAGAWVLEDDYDSEFRYQGRPLAALQGLDEDGRVIYVGSFSKVMFPSMRLGYLVVPANLVDVFSRARAALDDHASTVLQPALAEFMRQGHFAGHVRRMRKRYAARQSVLLAAAGASLRGMLELSPDPAGMHVVAGLAPALRRRHDDRTLSAMAASAGINAPALSSYFTGQASRQGLLLGYAAYSEDRIADAVEALSAALATAPAIRRGSSGSRSGR
jgi:GntR family transcriptional regulator/MocR family aminotransferase